MPENEHPPFAVPCKSAGPAPTQAFWLPNLFFRPRRFFSHFSAMVTPFSAAYAALALGVSETANRIAEELLKRGFGHSGRVPDVVLSSWAAYWICCLVLGVLVAALYYLAGGWWYRVRLGWSGDEGADHRLARQVYVFASLIAALPLILFTLLDTMRYATPLMAERAMPLYWVPATILPFWSVYASYRGVRTIFAVEVWKARLWFLFLPALAYGAAFLVVFMAVILGAVGVFDVPPNLQHANEIDRPAFTLEYPGNWWVEDGDDDYDPDTYFSITSIQEFYVTFSIYDELGDPAAETAETLEYYRKEFAGGEITEFSHWGGFEGSGAGFVAESDWAQHSIRVFSASDERRFFSVVEIVDEDVAGIVEPGLELIRKSFAFRE